MTLKELALAMNSRQEIVIIEENEQQKNILYTYIEYRMSVQNQLLISDATSNR